MFFSVLCYSVCCTVQGCTNSFLGLGCDSDRIHSPSVTLLLSLLRVSDLNHQMRRWLNSGVS